MDGANVNLNEPKVAVTPGALIKRINRRLAKEDEQLRVSRGDQMWLNVGAYYTVCVSRNYVSGHDVDPEALGRELGVLKPWEQVEGAAR